MGKYYYNGAIQSDTIKQTGEYQIVAYGGAGGNSNTTPVGNGGPNVGGEGGRTVGYFNFQAGEQLKILVGGKGQNGTYAGGGGGGTFVIGSAPSGSSYNGLVLVAGGGGGASIFGNGGNGNLYSSNGRHSYVPGNGSGGAAGQSGTARGGPGGLTPYKFSGGGGGAGVKSGGSTGQTNGYAPGTGGTSKGGYGYTGGSGAAAGGFGGGGGAASGKYGGAGGGGGYTGGNGGPGDPGGSFFSAGFQFSADFDEPPNLAGNGAVFVTYVGPTVTCFASGTLIRTVRGDVATENLAVGDMAVTASGAHRPITWIGHRAIDCHNHPRPHEAMPIRVAAHAFGPALPARDLWLSPGHPVLVGADADNEGGHLVPIMCLVNGTTIARVSVEHVTYWHVELDEHDILLAENLLCESYLDWGDRGFFTEGSDHALANPDFVVPGLGGRCRPVAVDGQVVEATRCLIDAAFASRLTDACAWPTAEGDALAPG